MKELTERQQNILNFIEEYRNKNGFPPTLREMADHFGIASTFGVKRHLNALVKKGYLNVGHNRSRGISINKSQGKEPEFINDAAFKVPIVGRVAAGSPITAIENLDGYVVLDKSFSHKAAGNFALKVKGDSMVNAGIVEGDVVVVSPGNDVKSGDIVVAMIDGDVTVKTMDNKGGNIKLIPQNDKYLPISVTDENEFSVIGKVVGLLRWM